MNISRNTSKRDDVVHIFEPGGQGGVYQHTVEVARLLASDGVRVVVHTATDHELHDTGVEFCLCFDWYRDSRTGRSLRIALRFLLYVAPHLARTRGSITWVQGSFKPRFTLFLIVLLRIFGHPVLFSPHNTFVRGGSAGANHALEACMRSARRTVVYNTADERILRSKDLRVARVPLVQYTPEIPHHILTRWRDVIKANDVRVCSVGQLRSDKNLDMLVESCQRAGLGLLIAGADLGAADAIRNAVDPHSNSRVLLFIDYLDLKDLSAIVAATGLVALPYSISSQSGVAELGIAYGASIVAYDVGGLAERADFVVKDLSVETWARELLRVAEGSPRPEAPRLTTDKSRNLESLRSLLRTSR